jgi:putative transposase
MGYSIDLRKRVIQFIEKGGSVIEAAKFFSVNRQSVYNWIKKKKDTGSLKDTIQGRPWRKLNAEALVAFVDSNPDLTLGEYAQKFGTIPSTICEAFKRLRITRKKRQYAIENEMSKKGQYFWQSYKPIQKIDECL